jgi:hypothetical protein
MSERGFNTNTDGSNGTIETSNKLSEQNLLQALEVYNSAPRASELRDCHAKLVVTTHFTSAHFIDGPAIVSTLANLWSFFI